MELDESICALTDPIDEEERLDIVEKQNCDPVISRVLRWIATDDKPTGRHYRALSPELKAYANIIEQLFVDRRGILMKSADPYADEDRPLFCLPESMQGTAIRSLHDMGHMGETSTLKAVASRFFLPHPTVAVSEVIKTCSRCQKNQKNPPQRHTFESDTSGYPGEKISCDYVGPLKTTRQGFKYLFTILDHFTRWFGYASMGSDGE